MRVRKRLATPKRKRSVALLAGIVLVAALSASVAGVQAPLRAVSAYVPANLLASARAHPQQVYRVILQGSGRSGEARVAAAVRAHGASVGRALKTIGGASAGLTGRQLVQLASTKGVAAITVDQPVRLTGYDAYWSDQQWPYDVSVQKDWWKAATDQLKKSPAIAIVDSGVQANRTDFGNGSQVIAQTTFVNTGNPNSPGDGYGHGTFVAGIADGSADGYAGTSPAAPIVSVDVLDDTGMGLTSDVIAACGWIIQHKAQYNIKVANFSLHAASPASVFWDPLDQAVEQLWFDGITVVAAAGNYGTSDGPSGVLYAPGNDPFVITVGADDTGGTRGTRNDQAAPWSAYGYTYDGFAKPEVAAPGRYMIGPVPDSATLPTERPGSVTATDPGYMELSGTSFAAPIVSGEAAYLLALHPTWTPDQIKGAIMLSARPEPNAIPLSVGVGLVNVTGAGQVNKPPNPNAALDKFVHPVPGNPIPVFDTASWSDAAHANASWSDASWSDASWSDAAWATASWSDASWSDAAWATSAYGTASWSDASWSDASWSDASWSDTTQADLVGGRGSRR